MREPQPEVNEQLQKRSSAVENAATNSAAFAQRHSQFAGPTEIVAKTFGSDTEIFQSLKLILQCRGISDKAGISVASFARRIAVELQKGSKYADCILPSFLEHLHLAAQLYELGCPPIDRNSIEINRMPRAVELALVKKHADIGAAIFNEYIARNSNSVFLKVVRDVALAHRERWDGRGYPDGLCETDIPLAARIVAVAACFHALTAERRFGNTYSPEVARNIISGEAGDQFDPLVIRAFEDAFADVALQCSGLRNEQPPKCDLQLSRELEFGGNRHGTAPRVSEAAARLKKGLQPSLLSRSTQQRSPASFKTRLRQGLLSGDTRSLGNVADDVVQFAIATANDELQTAAQNLLIMIRSDCSIETITMAFDCLMEAVE